jgi:hypothetical protein
MSIQDNKSLGISGTLFSSGKQGGSGGYFGNPHGSRKKKIRPFEEDEILSPPAIQPPFDMTQIRFLKP